MSSPSYAEDVFLDFYDLVVGLKLRVQPQDLSALTSFYNIVSANKQLTENQANFILKLLLILLVPLLSSIYHDHLYANKHLHPNE